jgi:ribosomal protein L40E
MRCRSFQTHQFQSTKNLMSSNTRILITGVDARMVYCSKCGTLNSDEATVCSNCGAPLRPARVETRREMRRRLRREEYEHRPRRGGAIAVLAIGLIFLLWGFSILVANVYGIDIPWGPILLVLIGLFIIIAGLRARNRMSRRY